MSVNNSHIVIANDIVAILKLCQDIQSEKEGVKRAAPDVYTRDDDPFADRIQRATGYVRQLQNLLPMMQALSTLGTELERQGKIQVEVGEDYTQRALEYFMT